jgi:signal transduction histidine kinase
VTHQVELGRVRVYDASLQLEARPPEDLFDTPAKTIAELLQFDPQAGAFQRVRVTGQVVHARGAEHFLMAGDQGLRFLHRKPDRFAPGDEVEVVGFSELAGSASPVLREAVARKTGWRTLPTPVTLTLEGPTEAVHDSTRVSVEGVLTGTRRTASEQILEIQNGVRRFAARVQTDDSALAELPVGARLALSGVLASHAGPRTGDREIAGFDLLINSPQDVRVLAKPPWWTLRRLLIVVALLVCGLAMTMLWITQLRSQVDQRSTELASQIKQRERVEYERAIDRERARIAQDLHDELGAGITEISMLAARAKGSRSSEDRRRHYLDEVWSRARALVISLDEIVWAMDPHHDSISSLVSYCSLHADRFLGLAGIAWRLEGSQDAANVAVDSHQRHQLFLVFKEALNNVVRHSGADLVRLRVNASPRELSLEIIDNGSGLPTGKRTESMTGLEGMRRRMHRIGGRCEILAEPGKGTVVRVTMPTQEGR